ncbi:MAG: ABC transporter ATP-binding protein [Pseudomonadota bacterium]
MSPPVVELTGIRKVFPGVVANDGVDLTIRASEIHALLGENGAGKSTLMSVLMGLYRPDAGSIRVRGREVRLRSPRDALRLGIGMVQQRFVQSERHTALENIVLGHSGLPFLPRRERLAVELREVAARYGFDLDLLAPIHTLPVGERQKVEILRVLHHGATVLILDEPTAVLSRQETSALFSVLRRFVADGGAVIFISHKLDEVLAIADRTTVLRHGRSIATREVAGQDAASLARLMVGQALCLHAREAAGEPGPVVASLRGIGVRDARGRATLAGLDLELRAGEVLGVAGVSGSGQVPLAEVCAGLQRPAEGSVTLFGEPAPVGDAGAFRDRGVAYVPEDRDRTGVAGSLSLTENLILKSYRRCFTRAGLLQWGAARRWAEERIAAQDIQCPGPGARTASLSGGNVQKVILARELAIRTVDSPAPRLIVAAYPCRGLDVGAAEAVRAALLQACRQGAAVLLLSEDLDELFRLSDRIGVLFRGRLAGPLPTAALTREQAGLMMGGHRIDEGAC